VDFDAYRWQRVRSNDDDPVVDSLQRDVRRFRREHGRGGHRFRRATLKSVWHIELIHAVVNHTDDLVWQHWYNHPSRGWTLQHWYDTRREAQAAAELPLAEILDPVRARPTGLRVEAGWAKGSRPIVVSCSSPGTAAVIQDVLGSIGCIAAIVE